MSLLVYPTSGPHGNPLSNVSSTHSTRAQRNRLYRSGMKDRQLPEEAREFYQTNPNAHGAPRAYRLQFEEPEKDHKLAGSMDRARVTFNRFGDRDSGLKLNGHEVSAGCLDFQRGTNTCTFGSQLPLRVDGETRSTDVAGYFNLGSSRPSGTLGVGDREYRVSLEPDLLTFNVQVSVNDDAYWDTANNKLVWKDKGEAWKNADWEQSMRFAYRTVSDHDPIEPRPVIENHFTDTSSDPGTDFNLTIACSDDFTCVLKDIDGQLTMQTVVNEPALPPASRTGSRIQSVFPSLLVARFDPFGTSLTGAYKDKEGRVYAMKGEVSEDDEPPLLPALASMAAKPPASDRNALLHNRPAPQGRPPRSHPAKPPANMKVLALLGNDSMIPDKTDPTGYADSVAQLAMRDFHDIIVYYMDEKLRKTFVSVEPPALVPQVKHIAESNKEENAKFYRSLQVPYLTAMLASSTVEEGKKCNRVRAEKLLKEIPANSKVYKDQSAALYRFRYLEKFPTTVQFLRDQRDKDYSVGIDKIATEMKQLLRTNIRGLEGVHPDGFEDRLAKAESDIDQLAKWAKQENLYWAFRLLYWVETHSLPTWYAQYTTGNQSSSMGMNIKKMNGLFEVLENNKINQDGKSFAEAHNDAIRMFQMQSIIPRMVDLDGCFSEFDSLLKESLQQFWTHYKDSKDINLMEQANHAKKLYQKNQIRRQFLDQFKVFNRVPGSAASWNTTVQMWEKTVRNTRWFKILHGASRFLELMKVCSAVALLVMPMLPGVWSSLKPTDKVMWGVAVAGMVAVVTVRIAQGSFRYIYFWKQISGWKDTLKTIFGFEAVVDKIPGAANRISSCTGRYFARTAKQAAILAEEETALPFGGIRYYSRFSRMFGRTIAETVGSIVGFVLAAVCLYMSAMSLAKETNPLLITVDVLMILSSTVQILAFAAGWAIAWGVTTALSTLSLIATWGGPIGMVLAIIGVIVLVVWMYTHKEENPVEEFVNDKVKSAGLYMNYTAIDYLEGVAATGTTASRYGVSVGWVSKELDLTYLALDAPNQTVGQVKGVPQLDFTSDTVWALRTDGYGRSQVYTQKSYPDEDGGTFRIVWFLSATDDERGVCVRRLPNKANSRDDYERARKFTHWTVTAVANPDMDDTTEKPIGILCNVSYTSTLVLQVNEKQQLCLGPQPAESSDFNRWMFRSESLGPLPFHYNRNPWTIHTTDKNEKTRALSDDPLATSTGYQWSIIPSLDARYLELVTAGDNEGTISMKEGVTPAVMSKTLYTVTCTLLAGNGMSHGQQQATVEIEVVDELMEFL